MPGMTHTTKRVTYRGDPAGASLLEWMLKGEGVTVQREQFQEQRGMGEMAQEVIVQMVAAGNLMAIKVAVDKFRKHMHGKAEVTVEVEEDADPRA
jgi:hypothetical protein